MKPDFIPEGYIAIILREVLLGLTYLHSEGKIHRDIKGILIFLLFIDDSRQFTSHGNWRSQTRGFWRLRTTYLQHDKEKHFRWNTRTLLVLFIDNA